MNFRGMLSVALGLALAGPLLRVEAAPALALPAPPEAVLVVLGDQHSAYDRCARLVALVDEVKATHPGLPLAVLLDGDTQEYGNALARRTAGTIDFAVYRALAERAPTIVNLGNHEPEFFALAETVQRIEATGVRVVSNITNRATGQPYAPDHLPLSLGAQEATVVGVATDFLATYRVAVRPSLDLPAPALWARDHFPTLLSPKPGALNIVLSHAGIAADRAMLGLVPEGTLFAGAHDHQRFVEPMGRTVYFHSGAWNSHASLVWLTRDAHGDVRWRIEQVELDPAGPGDPAIATLVATVMREQLTPEDREVIGTSPQVMAPPDAGKFAAESLRRAAGVDAAFIGNTTFGAGLPAGDVTRLQFDACVRFDGDILVAEVDGARLRALLAAANLTPATPFAQRRGEFNWASGPAEIADNGTYRLATTDWGARNTDRYFGAPAIAWRPLPGVRLKAAVLAQLAPR